MFSSKLLLTLLPLIAGVAAQVKGAAEGFAKGTTGGGSATPAYPKDIAELKTWLSDSTPRVIMLDREYNFLKSEGSVTETGCRPASNKCPGAGGQDAINGASWCTKYNHPPISVTYDKAGVSGLTVGSNKSLVGVGSKGVIRGKGLRMANGVKNVIIQNVHITELNPQYIWGGDAITVAGADLIWIDHCKTSLIGRQMIVLGTTSSNRITISNNEIDGQTSWSASCDNRHYWALFFTGSSDLITFKNNYIHHTSGRAPKIDGKTTIHAVNNYWYSTSGHAFDIYSGSNAVVEGNVFQNVPTPLLSGSAGNVFASPSTSANAGCAANLGHACQLNSFGSSGAFPGSSTAPFAKFAGKTVAGSVAPNAAAIKAGAGVGKI